MVSLAAAFASAGRRVDIYVPQHRGDANVGLPPGITIRALGPDASSAPKRPPKRQAYAQALAEALVRDRPDLLFSAGAASCVAIAVRAKAILPELPLIVRASSHPRRPIPWRRLRHRLFEPFRRMLRGRRYRAADLIIAVGEEVATAVHQMAPKVPLVVLPSPIVTSKFIEDLAGPAPEHPWLTESAPFALAVGRLAVPKDFPTLLRAFALVRSRRELRLVILGDGGTRYRQELAELARKLGVEKDVDFLGWTSNVPGWLARASVFVSTSIWEGSPGVIIEALAAGCPIVATDCPGDTRHLLRNGRLGGLAPVGNVRMIADLIEKQLDHSVDPKALRAAAAPYREEFAAKAYLEALDSFAPGRARHTIRAEDA